MKTMKHSSSFLFAAALLLSHVALAEVDFLSRARQLPSWGEVQQTESVESHVRDCSATRIHLTGPDPIDNTVGDTLFVDYAPNGPSLGTVIIIPPTGGENVIDRIYARHLCLHGISASIIERWPKDLDPNLEPQIHDQQYLRGLVAIRRVDHWIHSSRQGPVGIIGTSVGSLYSLFALEMMNSLQTGVLIVSGAPLSEILAHSDLKPVIAQRAARLQAWHLNSIQEYEQTLKNDIQIDTLKLAPELRKKHIQQYIGLADTTVPTNTQLALWEAAGNPAGDSYESNHVVSVVKTYWEHREDIAQFFLKEFKITIQ
jgi:hypothetical protein